MAWLLLVISTPKIWWKHEYFSYHLIPPNNLHNAVIRFVETNSKDLQVTLLSSIFSCCCYLSSARFLRVHFPFWVRSWPSLFVVACLFSLPEAVKRNMNHVIMASQFVWETCIYGLCFFFFLLKPFIMPSLVFVAWNRFALFSLQLFCFLFRYAFKLERNIVGGTALQLATYTTTKRSILSNQSLTFHRTIFLNVRSGLNLWYTSCHPAL